jgi:outer membrane murein-binding lipoprotein Lpp
MTDGETQVISVARYDEIVAQRDRLAAHRDRLLTERDQALSDLQAAEERAKTAEGAEHYWVEQFHELATDHRELEGALERARDHVRKQEFKAALDTLNEALASTPQPIDTVWEVERDRHGIMFSGPHLRLASASGFSPCPGSPPRETRMGSCRVYWGTHGCRLERGHDGPHECECARDAHGELLPRFDDEGVENVGGHPFYGPETRFYGEDVPSEGDTER